MKAFLLFSLDRLSTIKVCLFCSSPSSLSSITKDATEVLQNFGCGEAEISKIFDRHPAVLKSNPIILSSKLNLLLSLGLTASNVVKIIYIRPRILSSRFDRRFSDRVDILKDLFGPREELLKAITRNPSLLTYNHNVIRQSVTQYEQLGVSKQDLVSILLTRPTLFPRTSFDDEKLEYIKKTGYPRDDKMYKYIVSIIGVSRLDTICEKVMNIEKFGLTNDQVWFLFGKSPLLLSLSSLKGKHCRFLKAFIHCHPKDVADELINVYTEAKSVKRLAETSRRIVYKGSPS
ncbi:hypothetical protein ACHQM5_012283 [Ranunculus cassubicifolius]